MKDKIIFDFKPVIHFDLGGRRYACNPRCNANRDKLTKDKELVTCKNCMAYLKKQINAAQIHYFGNVNPSSLTFGNHPMRKSVCGRIIKKENVTRNIEEVTCKNCKTYIRRLDQ